MAIPALSRDLIRAVLWVVLWALLGAFVGSWFHTPWIGVSVSLALRLGLHLRYLVRLRAWLERPKQVALPIVGGIWGEVFDGLLNLQKRNRKRKKKLAAILAEFQASTEALPDGAVVLGPNGEIVWFNAAAQALLGLRLPQDLGLRVPNLVRAPAFTDSEIGAFELIEARRLLEAEVAALAATLISEEQIAELEALVQKMGDADPVKAEKADREFHILIAQSTGNGALTTCVENLWDWRYHSPLARNVLARAADLGMNDRIAEHTDILTALKNRSVAAARQAMHEHMDRVIEHLLRATEIVAVENARKASSERRMAVATRMKALKKGR